MNSTTHLIQFLSGILVTGLIVSIWSDCIIGVSTDFFIVRHDVFLELEDTHISLYSALPCSPELSPDGSTVFRSDLGSGDRDCIHWTSFTCEDLHSEAPCRSNPFSIPWVSIIHIRNSFLVSNCRGPSHVFSPKLYRPLPTFGYEDLQWCPPPMA